MTEFLPLCDVLFNVISLAAYFCDVVFDVVLGYALFERGRTGYFTIIICLVLSSLFVSQIVSFRWYWSELKRQNCILSSTSSNPTDSLDKKDLTTGTSGSATTTTSSSSMQITPPLPPSSPDKNNKTKKIQQYTVIALHFIQLGVLWRYAKLFVPVDLRRVKHEVRDLCMLRLVHAFCEAAPMLLLQLYLLITIQSDSKFLLNTPELKLRSLSGQSVISTVLQVPTLAQQQAEKTFKDLNIISAALSLFSVCWALASFSKNVRLQNVHRLVLTWLGVIFQFLWRLGTVTSRIASLTVYASFYNYWVFLVIVLHWFSMFLWLISPKNIFHGESISKLKKILLSSLIAFVYVFAYINLQEVNHRQKMITFYIVMFLENTLLVCLWLVGVWTNKPIQWYFVPVLVFGTFLIGMIFMVLYYRYFHIRRLGYDIGNRYSGNDDCEINRMKTNLDKNGQPIIAGVFNCRFSNPVGNGATKRKKKKPTSFIPPPALPGYTSQLTASITSTDNNLINSATANPLVIPFWRRPLPRSTGGSSENEGSVGSRVNIQQKLQEKKQKQLAELKIIEEEIKQGKLGGPLTMCAFGLGDDGRTSLPRQPIPRAKKHINLEPIQWCDPDDDNHQQDNGKSYNNIDEINNLNKFTSSQYDQIYASFGFTGINIPTTLETTNVSSTIQQLTVNPQQITSQPATENNSSLTRQVPPRSKMLPVTTPRNLFNANTAATENYHCNVMNSPVSNNLNGHNNPSRANSPVRNTNRVFDHLNHQNIFLEINHPRQISGTYSSSTENGNHLVIDNKLPFPFNVVPPPRSKLDSRSTPPTPSIMIQAANAASQSSKFNQRHLQRAKTPEVLLAPHYLDNSRIYYDWIGRDATFRVQDDEGNHVISSGDENLEVSAADDSIIGATERSGNRNASDIDSQVSLPRSYTLPREFRYYRRPKVRKFQRNEQFIASTNSSDGDVDSGDDNESELNSDTSQCRLKQRQQHQQKSRTVHQKQNNYHHNHLSTNVHHSNKLRCHRNNYLASPSNIETNTTSSCNVPTSNVTNSINPSNCNTNNGNNANNILNHNGGNNNLILNHHISGTAAASSSSIIVNNLDLIHGVDSSGSNFSPHTTNNNNNNSNNINNNNNTNMNNNNNNNNNFSNRPSKYRIYGTGKNVLVPWRHETKL